MRDGMLVAFFAALQSTIEWLRRLEMTCHFILSASSIVDQMPMPDNRSSSPRYACFTGEGTR
jgi:hypothetical protein